MDISIAASLPTQPHNKMASETLAGATNTNLVFLQCAYESSLGLQGGQ
jgi:hypothetical protein